MKKVYLVLAALVIGSISFGQIGFQVIGSASNLSFKSTDVPDAKKSFQPAFGAGVVAQFPLVGNLSLKPSLNFLQKNNSLEFGSGEQLTTLKTKLNFIELPLDFVYTIPGKSASFYFGAGPSVGYGISGKMKFKGLVADENGDPVAADESVDAFAKEDKGGAGMSRIDISANAIAGLKFTNGLFVNAGYLASLRNLAEGDGKYKNYGVQLTLGYLLSK